MSISADVIKVLINVLQLQGDNASLEEDTPLLGAFPEFDSMAVVSILTALEDKYGFYVDDDEVDGQIFETIGSLTAFVKEKL